MKKILLFLALLASLVSANAQFTINSVSGYGQRSIVDYWGNPVGQETIASVGTFADGFDPIASARDFKALAAHWVEIGHARCRPLFGQPGHFAFTAYAFDPWFNNRKLWWLIYNDSGHALYTCVSLKVWTLGDVDGHPLDNLHQLDSDQIDYSPWGRITTNRLVVLPGRRPAATPPPEQRPKGRRL